LVILAEDANKTATGLIAALCRRSTKFAPSAKVSANTWASAPNFGQGTGLKKTLTTKKL
jgi:hypothetical protein